MITWNKNSLNSHQGFKVSNFLLQQNREAKREHMFPQIPFLWRKFKYSLSDREALSLKRLKKKVEIFPQINLSWGNVTQKANVIHQGIYSCCSQKDKRKPSRFHQEETTQWTVSTDGAALLDFHTTLSLHQTGCSSSNNLLRHKP